MSETYAWVWNRHETDDIIAAAVDGALAETATAPQPTKRVRPSQAWNAAVFAGWGGRRSRRMLEEERERELVAAWRQHRDAGALRHLIDAHFPMLYKSATNTYDRLGGAMNGDVRDLMSEGVAGFIYALDRYDPENGARLATYAAHFVKASQIAYVNRNTLPFRVGTNFNEKRALARLATAKQAFRAEAGREPEVADAPELARLADVPVEVITRVMALRAAPAIPADAVQIVGRDAAPEEDIAARQLRRTLAEAIETVAAGLSPRDAAILRAMTDTADDRPDVERAQELAGRFSLTIERIRQIRRATFAELRRRLEGCGFDAVCELA